MQTKKTTEELDEIREKEDLKKLEAVFFISGRFLNMSELISLTDLNPIIIRELIEKLKEKYRDIIELMKDSNLSLRQLAARTQYSINTIRRIKKIISDS